MAIRPIYCPICATECEQEWRHVVLCPKWGGFSPLLQGSLRASVYAVDLPKTLPRKPEVADWLWCPNCTGELDEYDEVGKFLRCPQCALHLRGVSLVELISVKEEHQSAKHSWEEDQ